MKLRMALGMVVALFAMAVQAQAADPTGTWKWTMMGGGGGGGGGGTPREVTLKLKLEGDKLTGSMPGRMDMETAIEEGTFKDGEISFKVTRTRGETKIVTKYTGKLDGDTIKGKIESERMGTPTSLDWEAKREKAP